MSKKRKSIAARWFVNSFSIIAAIMIVIIVGIYFTAKSYYYNAVSQYLGSEANIISEVLTRYYEDSPGNYANEIRDTVEYFSKKNVMELMAIDKNGKPKISSSGFSPEMETEMPDYLSAISGGSGRGQFIGKLDSNPSSEKYMAITVVIESGNSDYNAIRLITSLDKVDRQLFKLAAAAVGVAIFVLLLVLLSGIYFITSIVAPIKEISKSAKKLAKGDFEFRLKVKRNDEIGDLCRSFNQMADELQDSEKIKNDFISSVSHELRTPLTAIKGWSETIMELKDEQTLAKGMRVISTETERLSSMVEELLDFSRIQNKKLLLQKANMDVVAELTDAVLIYTERAAKNDILINYKEPEGIAMVYGDKNRLRQVFLNIIDNGIKYSKKGGIINIDTNITPDKAIIKISDNGCGISKEDLPKVKNRFYKANNTVRGSGIGLAVADELIALHNGRLDIESELGKGTAVIITLPIVKIAQTK